MRYASTGHGAVLPARPPAPPQSEAGTRHLPLRLQPAPLREEAAPLRGARPRAARPGGRRRSSRGWGPRGRTGSRKTRPSR
eukprot:3827646-Rhodomonas_salina.1